MAFHRFIILLTLSLLSLSQALRITPAYTIVDSCGNTIEPGKDAFALWSVEKNAWLQVDSKVYLQFDQSVATTWTYSRYQEKATGSLGCRVHYFGRDGEQIAFKNVRVLFDGEYTVETVIRKVWGVEVSRGSAPGAIAEIQQGGKRRFILAPGNSDEQGHGAVGPYKTTLFDGYNYLYGHKYVSHHPATFYLYKQTKATKYFEQPVKCAHNETARSIDMKGSCNI